MITLLATFAVLRQIIILNSQFSILNFKSKVQGLALNGCYLVGNEVDVVVDEDGCLVDGQFLATGILSETAIVSHEVSQILCTRLHTQQDGAVHQGDVLRHVG